MVKDVYVHEESSCFQLLGQCRSCIITSSKLEFDIANKAGWSKTKNFLSVNARAFAYCVCVFIK